VLRRVPCQCRTPVAEQAKINLGAYVQGDDVEEVALSAVGYASHLLVVGGPFRLGSLFECQCRLLDLGPCLFTIFQEEPRVEFDAAADLELCC
jgi:hypothetical protein